jgi:hypothetical protein
VRMPLPLAILLAASTLGGCVPLATHVAPGEPVAVPGPSKPAPAPAPAPHASTRPSPAPAKPAPVVEPAPAEKPVPDEVRALYSEGVAAHDAGLFDVALEDWERVWQQAPHYEDVEDRLLGEYLVRGLELFAEGKLDGAVRYWEMARNVRPDDPRVQAYLERAHEQQERNKPVN